MSFAPKMLPVTMASPQIPQQVPTTLQLNTKGFLTDALARMEKSYDNAYPGGYFDEDKAHVAMSKLISEIRVLQAFVKNLG